MMSDAEVKESRVIMRQVQEHLVQAHIRLGAQEEAFGFVDIIYHPTNPIGYLNYITPRRNTAWISSKYIENGLDRLRERQRQPRITFVEGLFPPIFGKSLRDLGLDIERETPIMVYRPKDDLGRKSPPLPEDVHISKAQDQHGIAMWWYVWRNAYYDVYATGVEPLFVGRSMREIFVGTQIDLILYRYAFPVGVARVTFYQETAHITAHAILKEIRTPELDKALLHHALAVALEKKCELVFTTGENPTTRQLCREMGFLDSGSVVCYAEEASQTQEDVHDSLAQPVLIL